jgi:hypothetical protein
MPKQSLAGIRGQESQTRSLLQTEPGGSAPARREKVFDDMSLLDSDIVAVQQQIFDQIARELEQGTKPSSASEPANMSNDHHPTEEVEYPFPHGVISDEDIVLHQRLIMEQIQRESQVHRNAVAPASPTAATAPSTFDEPRAIPSNETPQTAFVESRRRSLLGSVPCPLSRGWIQDEANGEASGVTSNAYVASTASTEDCVQRLSNGRKLRLKGTRHVYKAMERGTSALAQCFNCQALLHVPDACTAVYCSLCHQVTPMDLARRRPSDDGVDLGDSEIAAALQRQELDLALSRDAASPRLLQSEPRSSV